MKLGLSMLVLWLLVAPAAIAGLRVHLDEAGLDDAQQQVSEQLLHSVIAILPPRMKRQLDREITLRWTARLPDEVIGRALPNGQILLNRRWLEAMVQGVNASFPGGRQHASLDRELQATLVHELAHFYDQGRLLSPRARTLINRCGRRQRSIGSVGLPVECLGQTQRRSTLSDDPRLLELAGWPMRLGGRGEAEQQNRQYLRSPDAYELTSPGEFVAVNLEYFLLDPDYPCRRPALYAFFRRHFGWEPSQASECVPGYPFISAALDRDRPALGMLDPERIYQVHYLLAEPSDAWASRWGHSMLRVVVCAPGRVPSPDCLLDLEHHLVLSFRAFVGDVQLSRWDGLTGAYPSRLFLLPLQQVVEEYTKVELRSLQSLPLKLSRDEQVALVERAIELHWSYDGTYYFVSNNCAVETLKLLRSGTDRPAIREIESVAPTGLLALLEAADLLDRRVLDDRRKAQRRGFYFDSYRERYRLMFEIVRERLGVPQRQVDDWLGLPAERRQAWIDRADRQAAAALLLLEQAAYRQQALLVLHDLKQRYMTRKGIRDAELEAAGGLMSQLLQESGFLSRPSDLLSSGYGVPQASERRQLADAGAASRQGLLALTERLDKRALGLLSAERRMALAGTEQNIALLGQRVRQLRLEAGGFLLP